MLVATVAGVLAGLGLTLLLPETYRAQATLVLTRQGEAPGENATLAAAADSAAELLRSQTVAESAVANLKLDEPAEELLDRIDVSTEARSSLLRLSVNAPEREEARRSAQEVAQVFTVLYNDRFGPAVTASLWEGARADSDPVSPRPVPNVVLGGLLGAAVAVAVAALRRPRGGRSVDARLAAVTARERALARRAAELSLREREVAEAGPLPAPPETVAAAAPERVRWRVEDVERLVAEQGGAFPERAEELRTYVDSIRGVADDDGSLPPGVEALVEDVFADLIAREIGSRG